MNKLSCTTLAAVVGSIAAFSAAAETTFDPTPAQMIPQSEQVSPRNLSEAVAVPRHLEGYLLTNDSSREVADSPEFAAARSAIGETYVARFLTLAESPFNGALGGADLVTTAAQPRPSDPNYNDPDGIPFSGDETGDVPTPQIELVFSDSTFLAGRSFTGINIQYVETEQVLPNGNVLLQLVAQTADNFGGELYQFGLTIVFTDPNDPNTTGLGTVIAGRVDFGNDPFGQFPTDPALDDGLEHNLGVGTTVASSGQIIGTSGVVFRTGFADINQVPEVGDFPAPDDVLLGLNFFQTDDTEIVSVGAFSTNVDAGRPNGSGIDRYGAFVELVPGTPLTDTGVCCVGGNATQTTITACTGTFFGVGSTIAEVNCPDCTPLADDANAADETFLFSDDSFGVADGFNAGCSAATPSFTGEDGPFDSIKGPASVGGNEETIGSKWQGTLGTRAGNEVDQDWWTFTPVADGTLTITAAADVPTQLLVAEGTPGDGVSGCSAVFLVASTVVGGSTAEGNCSDTLLADVVAGVPYYIILTAADEVVTLPDNSQTSVSGSGVVAYEWQASLGASQTGACSTASGCSEVLGSLCDGVFDGPGTTCATSDFASTFCFDVWDANGTDEGEAEICVAATEPTFFAGDLNDGDCVALNTVEAITIADGEVVNGESTAWNFDDFGVSGFIKTQRDIDAYLYDHTGGDLTVEATGQFDLQLDIIAYTSCDPGGAGIAAVRVAGTLDVDPRDADGQPDSAAACDTLTVVEDLPAGSYIIRVTNQFDITASCGVDFSTPVRYRVSATSGGSVCVPCQDLDGDNFVGTSDLLVLLGNWNQNVAAGTLGDADCDGFVGTSDLLDLLAAWNTAPGC